MSTLWPNEFTGGSHQGATDGAYAKPSDVLEQFGWPYDSQYRKQALEYLRKAEQRREERLNEQKRMGGAA